MPFEACSRRSFLESSALAAAGLALPGFLRPAEAATGAGVLDRLGVALYTVREQMKADPAATLKAIADLGYRYIESGLVPSLAAEVKAAGLKQPSAYAPTYLVTGNRQAWAKAGELLPESYTWDQAVAEGKARGLEYLVVVYLMPAERGGLDVYRDLAKRLAKAGETCRKAGLGLAYHPHAFEYEVIDGVRPIELMLKETPKDLLGLELDTFWASIAGVDPVKLVAAHAGRVPLVHLKDKAKGTPVQYDEGKVPKEAFKEIGRGEIDWAAFLPGRGEGGREVLQRGAGLLHRLPARQPAHEPRNGGGGDEEGLRVRPPPAVSRGLILAAAFAGLPAATTHAADEPYRPPPENLKARQWFQEARFGLFVHWGVYSVLADGEWVMHQKRMTSAEYERLPPQFNPVKFDPAAWVAMVKAAGMRYITITSKHHDGFAMFDSKTSDYDIVASAPRTAKDVLKRARRRVPPAGHQALLLPLAARLAPSRLLPARPDGPARGPGGEGRLEPLPRLHGRAAHRAAHRLRRDRRDLVRRLVGQARRRVAAGQDVRAHPRLQPQALVGSNHHRRPFPGEDFQMFEKDLPGPQHRGLQRQVRGRERCPSRCARP